MFYPRSRFFRAATPLTLTPLPHPIPPFDPPSLLSTTLLPMNYFNSIISSYHTFLILSLSQSFDHVTDHLTLLLIKRNLDHLFFTIQNVTYIGWKMTPLIVNIAL